MGRRIIQAALNGQGSYAGKCYFFLGPVYVRYDWARDRVDDGYPQRLGLWNLPAWYAEFDDALDGAGSYTNFAYFFRGSEYVKYDWRTEHLDGAARVMSAWSLPAPFDGGIDATLNGQAAYAGKAYFFKGAQYLRYDWTADAPDQAAASVSAWGLPAQFTSGLDAAVNGQAHYAGKAYFFKDDVYVRYDWATDHVDGGAGPIVGNWPGVAELLQAGAASILARAWVTDAIAALGRVAAGTEPATSTTFTALTTHFKADWRTHLATIRGNYESIARMLDEMPRRYRYRNHAEAVSDRGVDRSTPPVPYPAYAHLGGSISFTSTYCNYGPKSQAAMAVHETVHLFDGASGAADTHVSEWYRTYDAATAARTGWTTTYTAQPSDKAAHNASAYAAFAQHIHYGSDTRYGADATTKHL